jgi:hypothetical protein
MKSQKTQIIEALFNDETRWKNRKVGGQLVRSEVTFDDIVKVINKTYEERGDSNPNAKRLSSANPANFWKDFVRKAKSARRNWPSSISSLGYTGEALKGNRQSFEFVKFEGGDAFPTTTATYPKNPATTKLQAVQTLSVAPLFKALARKDENWLQSLAVSLHIPHMHLALHPDASVPLIEVGHMQSNMKLRKAEIDGLYLGTLHRGGVVLLTMEAKGDSDDILESQLLDQVHAIRSHEKIKEFLIEVGADQSKTNIIPMAMKLVNASSMEQVLGRQEFGVTGKKLLYLVDYAAVPYLGMEPFPLVPRGETLFDLRPPIKGINA